MYVRLITKAMAAAAGALVLDLSDLLLDKVGITDDDARATRTIIKATISTGMTLIVDDFLDTISDRISKSGHAAN